MHNVFWVNLYNLLKPRAKMAVDVALLAVLFDAQR